MARNERLPVTAIIVLSIALIAAVLGVGPAAADAAKSPASARILTPKDGSHPGKRLLFAKVKVRGTFAAIRSKIPYLKELGINCIELMPVYEFDEYENSHTHPETGELLVNYWGYSTVGFFAPKAGFAATGKNGMQVDEFKTLVKELHKNGIEIILDVVFNHTAEGNERGPTISFRGLDNKTYYMLTPEGYYFNFSGTGNTLNCNNPIGRSMVLDCLRY